MHAIIYAYIHTYIHTYIHIYIYTPIGWEQDARSHICIHTYIHTYTYIHTLIDWEQDLLSQWDFVYAKHLKTGIYVYVCVYIYMHTYIHTHTYIYINTYIYTPIGWEQDALSQWDFICSQDRETGRLCARDFNHINGTGHAPVVLSHARRSPVGSTRNESFPSFRLDADNDGTSMHSRTQTQTQAEDAGSIPHESPV
jgi:hypothetical protein